MTSPHVATPTVPTIVYDGDCQFCRRWVARWKETSGDRVAYVPYQQAAARYPEIAAADFASAVHLIEPDGRVTRGAQAVLRARKLAGNGSWLLWKYEHVPLVGAVAEAGYRLVAANRGFANYIDLTLLGPNTLPVTYKDTRRWFLRFLAVIYLIAFSSLWTQIGGLIGSHGIWPAADYMQALRHNGAGFFQAPTLLWLSSSDAMLGTLCAAGLVMSVMLLFRVVPVFAAFGAWFCYLSLIIGGPIFFQFQWDALLLEAGFLAIFLAPLQPAPNPKGEPPVPRLVIWLFRWLLFRLMFLAGAVKFFHGDPTWHNLTALNYHYWTQPLPPWTAWYANLLPEWFQKFSVVCVAFVELVVPWFYFAPRQPRKLALWLTVGFQFLIIITGNFGFFNWLTLALSFLLIDDTFWPFNRRPEPIKRYRRPTEGQPEPLPVVGTPLDKPEPEKPLPVWPWPMFVTAPMAVFIVFVTTVVGYHRFEGTPLIHAAAGAKLEPESDTSIVPHWADSIALAVGPFDSTKAYGLFEQMTTTRPELVIEGTNDGLHWKEYEFNWKPGDPHRQPQFCAPYMPRLDWQMWFAALEMDRLHVTPQLMASYQQQRSPWLVPFLRRLLQNEPQVTELLASRPFDGPPRAIRATIYNYHFTDLTDAKDRAWWRRHETSYGTGILELDPDGKIRQLSR